MIFFQILLVCSVFFLVLTPLSFADLDSPRKQIKLGVSPEKVTCNEGFVLMLRPSGISACVKPLTAEKLEDKGWTTMIKKFVKSEKEIETVPASSMSVVNFYISDHDLNLAHNAVETVSANGLFEITVNGVPIDGPENMIETGFDTGRFFAKLELPDTINGVPLNQDDVVLIRYLDASDAAGEKRVLTKSVELTKTFAKVGTSGGGSRIGHEFIFRIYEPDANRDSRDEDKIPLSSFEYRGDGGIRTTLANPRFNANSGSLIETGPNTSTFEVKIKIPRELDGKPIHIGDKYEIRYIDRSTPSGTDEKVVFNGRIG
ncbi:MAG: hypothetical protein HOK63_04715 [Thaumarchaeota archaeon]|jgi:hypothetical protein|nr:hypothetical protein [Nitrososphaerota archaeon]MBT5842076.1 hypothetical protein [Nitrososphaerota archaeon]MBT6468934.1 hypothetical protein [Nitrososphaerota archaeon]